MCMSFFAENHGRIIIYIDTYFNILIEMFWYLIAILIADGKLSGQFHVYRFLNMK